MAPVINLEGARIATVINLAEASVDRLYINAF